MAGSAGRYARMSIRIAKTRQYQDALRQIGDEMSTASCLTRASRQPCAELVYSRADSAKGAALIHRLLVVVTMFSCCPGSLARARTEHRQESAGQRQEPEVQVPRLHRRIVEERRGEGRGEAGTAVQPRDRRDRYGRRHGASHRHVGSDPRHGPLDDQQPAFRGTNRDRHADHYHGVCVGRQRPDLSGRSFAARLPSRCRSRDTCPSPACPRITGECEVPAAVRPRSNEHGRWPSVLAIRWHSRTTRSKSAANYDQIRRKIPTGGGRVRAGVGVRPMRRGPFVVRVLGRRARRFSRRQPSHPRAVESAAARTCAACLAGPRARRQVLRHLP